MADGGSFLAPLRVLDLARGDADAVTRILADLGADVLKVEPPGGSPARTAPPALGTVSIPFALRNANKRGAVLDPAVPADRSRLTALAAGCDIVVDGGNPSGAAGFGTSCAALAERFPHLVALSVTDFGTDGPRAAWRAGDAELYALSSALSRTGPTTGRPVLPPIGVASSTAAVQAAWAALVAYFNRLVCGTGEFIDFSRLDAVVQALDPPFGSHGQAVAGLKEAAELWRGRPRNQQIYPTFACADGHVRICVLSPRQWRAMRAWLGEPAEFAGPEFDTIAARYVASADLNARIGQLCAARTMNDLVADGQARGVPIAAVLEPVDALRAQHFRVVGALADAELAPGVRVTVPVGPFVIDGAHAGFGRAAPAAGADEAAWIHRGTHDRDTAPPAGPSRPFTGIRVLDLGVIVAGGELGRLFADLGAEVIKVESEEFPDGLRQAPPGQAMSRSWALTHRNEYSIGLNLRVPAGADIFAGLVANADVVFANFKPGALVSLGFSYDRLRAINPRVVLAESSAFGAAGPWSARMGYGPLVRATTGITRLWTSEDAPGDAFWDATTIFPDHVVARVAAIATLAALIHRTASDTGAHIHISQAETAINQLDVAYVAEAARAAGLAVTDDPAVHAVYPCSGDDEWCVISVRCAAERDALAAVMGAAGLPADRAGFVAAVSAWTANRDKGRVADALQAAGVPAAPMNRAADVLADPQLRFRRLFTDLRHPMFDAPIPSETGPAPYLHIPPAQLRPAPAPGQHTRPVCRTVLGLEPGEIERLIADGVLFTDEGRIEGGNDGQDGRSVHRRAVPRR